MDGLEITGSPICGVTTPTMQPY